MADPDPRWLAAAAIIVVVLAGLPALPGVGVAGVRARALPAWTTQLVLGDAVGLPTPVSAHRVLQVTVTLEPNNGGGLQAFDVAVQNPYSPRFHHFLSESQFEARFGPPTSNLTSLVRYFSGCGAHGLRASADRLALTFSINTTGAERAFSSRLMEAAGPGAQLAQGFNGTPAVPAPLVSMIAGVGGLSGVIGARGSGNPAGSGVSHHRPFHVLPQFLTGSGHLSGTQWFVGSDYVGLYNETPLLPGTPGARSNASFASSEAVATLLASGYNGSRGVNLPPWDPARVDQYFNATFPSTWPRPRVVGVPVMLAGIVPPAPGPSPSLNDDSGDVIENSLDLEMAGSTAPGAKVVNFYFPASLEHAAPVATTNAELADDFANDLSNALAYNYSPQRLVSVSASFGIPDVNDSFWNSELEHAAALGVTVVASSGDSGNAPLGVSDEYQGEGPAWPASAAFNASGAVAIGGTSLSSAGRATGTLDGNGVPTLSYDPSPGPIAAQSVWYDTLAGSGNVSGSQGGGAPLYREPQWQYHSAAQPAIAVAEGLQSLGSLSRAGPDLSLSANTTLAETGTAPNGTAQYSLLQGTSVSAPLFAGMVAEWAAVAGHRFGFVDPAIYHMECYYEAHPGNGNPFLAVTTGSNYLFSASPGWNAATGWGGVDASRFLNAISTVSIVGFRYSGPTPGLAHPAAAPTTLGILLIAGVATLLAGVVLAVVVVGRRSPSGRFGLASPGFGPGLAAATGTEDWEGVSMFDCPFCAHPRPAEPVRCPTCGQW